MKVFSLVSIDDLKNKNRFRFLIDDDFVDTKLHSHRNIFLH